MNYLAHAYLSFGRPDILAGNMISDFVKGKKKYDYSPEIQKGIALHRAIDEFTDAHEATKAARTIFQANYGLYSAVFMDVVYDHFLAKDPNQFTNLGLLDFAITTYATLEQFEPVFPPKFKMLFPYMKQYDWLSNYKTMIGIRRSFEGISQRAKFMSESETAFELFNKHYVELERFYSDFFPSVKLFAFDTLKSL